MPDKDNSCAVSILMDNLIDAFTNKVHEYFIQGVTVYEYEKEKRKNIVLVDGQQRTTTFFLLLKFLQFNTSHKIVYSIREESEHVLNSFTIQHDKLSFDEEIGKDYDLQDIFYFKKAITTIHNKLSSNKIKAPDFKEFILKNVKLFYIIIAKEKATKVFSMMNGQKAVMKTDELIKSALLSKASRENGKIKSNISSENRLNELLGMIKNEIADEWEINTLRSKFAREWDKWLYWWNIENVKHFFGSGDNPLGLLLEYYFELNKENENYSSYSFKNFNNTFFNNRTAAKLHFKGIRDLQKTFEDWYNTPSEYNYIGLILKASSNKKEALLYFLKKDECKLSFKEYSKWVLIGATHRQIIKSNELKEGEETKESKAETVYHLLNKAFVYWDENDEAFNDGRKEMAFRQLLRINVEMDNNLQRKFNFNIYNQRSLEHIQPKSKGILISGVNNNENGLSVHCIGNLVLLSGPDNSSFSDKDFLEKKKAFFNPDKVKESMSFLHSLTVFSESEWNENNILKNKYSFLDNYKKTYTINIKETTNEK